MGLCLAAALGAAALVGPSGATAAPSAPSAAPTPRELVYLSPEHTAGDLDGDQRVDSADLDLLIGALGVTSAGGATWTAVAKNDADGDGKITITDVAALSKQMLYDDGDFEIIEAGVVDAQASMEAGRLSAVELTQMYLDRIAAYDDATVGGDPATALNSILTTNDQALEIAADLDAERAESGPRGMLHGIPVIVKDNFNTIDMPTTVGCKCLDGFMPGSDAYMVEQLRAAGAVILAKANLTEFASGYTGISSYKRSSNVYFPGGESGGSSAGTGTAIAANLGMVGLGSDTGGSIQVPGAYQGLADVYQSFGLVSREGIAPLAGDQDRGGPLTRTLEDSVIMLDLYAGTDPADPTTAAADAEREASYASYLDRRGLDGARIGYVSSVGAGNHIGTNPAIDRIFQEAKATMAEEGATLVDIGDLRMQTTSSGSTREFGHDIDQFLKTYVPADSSYPGDAEELKALLTAQPELSSISASVIDRINRIPEYQAFMETHDDEIAANQATIGAVLAEHDLDAIVYPTVTRFGVPGGAGYSNVMIASLSGHPSVSVPSGWAEQSDYVEGGVLPANAVGLPTTVSFLGAMNADAELIKLGYAFEQATQQRRAPARFPDLAHPAKAVPTVTGRTTFQVGMPWVAPKAGETAHVTVHARKVPDAFSYTAKIRFDPTKVTPVVDEVTSGVSGLTRATVSGSTVTVVHTKLGSSPSAAGDFTMADIPFVAKGAGLGEVRLASVSLLGAESTVPTTYDAPPVTVTHPAKVTRLASSVKRLRIVQGRTSRLPFTPHGTGTGRVTVVVRSSAPKVAGVAGRKSVALNARSTLTVRGKKPGTSRITIRVHGKVLTIKVTVVAKKKKRG
ncbi:dockerin type I domain-containing protein [Nocardioides sp. cx-169]|uniref:amidase family protein n=1 Tax=Nocardioides sp. cx-169 TaxID=2899080 RepID=UPI001E5707E0|nr:amidase family protein [Nocardioides sp. cx-169]MCD4536534.1 dockerin type I domain-containing protein [Nocardioides sp. cx-169]